MSTLAVAKNYQDTLVTKQTPNDDTRDQARMLWHDLRWSDLITPAPSAISIFGQLTLVGVTTDFDLERPDGPNGRKFQHILNPSFRATVQQLRATGVKAFGISRTNMDALKKHCSILQATVNEIMDTLYEKDMDSMSPEERLHEIVKSLPGSLEDLRDHTKGCSAVVDDTVAHFTGLLDLAMELNVQTTASKSTADKTAKDIELQRTILDIRIAGETKRKEKQDAYTKEMQKYAENAEKRFDTAVNNTPTGGQLFLMQVGQKLTDTACMGAHVLIQKQLTGKQVATSLANDAISKALDKGLSSKPDPKPQEDPKKLGQAKIDEMDDPIFMNAEHVRETIFTFVHVLTCAAGGKPNWDDVMQKDAEKKSGLAFVKMELDELASAKYGSSNLAKDGKLIIDQALQLAKEIKEYNEKRMDERVNEIISEVKELNTKAEKLSAAVSHKSGQAPVQNPMQVNVPELPNVGDDNASVINLAVQNAQFQVSVTAQQMENSQLLYQKAHEDMQAITDQLNKFTSELEKLKSQEIDWDRIRGILVKTVDLLTQLVIQLESLREFFAIIANSVDVILATAFAKFARTANGTIENPELGGISLNEHSRATLLKHAVNASKVEYVMARIAKVYIKLYDEHIMPGMVQLAHLPAFADENDQEAKSKMVQDCVDLKDWAANAADGMRDVLDQERSNFEKEMKAREAEFKENFKPFLKDVDPKMTRAITQAKDQQVVDVTQVTQAVARRRAPPPRMTDD